MDHKIRVEQLITQHQASGKYISVQGIRTFVLDQGQGDAVLCVHGVPTSSFLYRKVIRELADHGFRGVSVDLPGLGLSERPQDFDYSFSSFARFLAEAASALGLQRYHLLLHDIGGPVGFSHAASHKDRILSLTILNTWIDVVHFKKPLPMRPFEKPLLGEAQLTMMNYYTWSLLFHTLGVADSSRISKAEMDAYVDLLKRDDGGKAFLKIMRNFEHNLPFREHCYQAVQQVPYPVQATWGSKDPGLTYRRYAREIQQAASLQEVLTLPAAHLLQEEQWEAIAGHVISLAHSSPVS